jgi:hypothetical protein
MSTQRREDSQLQLAGEAKGRDNWSVPVPGKRSLVGLRSSAVLEAAGAYDVSDTVDVWKSRRVHLHVTIDFAAAGNIVSIIPEVNIDGNPVEANFFPIAVTSGTVTSTVLGVTPSASYSGDYMGSLTFAPLEIRTDAATAANTLKMVVSVDVSQAKFFRVRAAEAGVPGTPSTVKIDISKSI